MNQTEKAVLMINLAKRSGAMTSEPFACFEFFVWKWRELTDAPRPSINAPAYPAWLALMDFVEQRIQSYAPDVKFEFER